MKLVSTVDGVKNLWLSNLCGIGEYKGKIEDEVNRLIDLTSIDGLSLLKLEQILKKTYGEGELKYIEGRRFANCFAWRNTQLHRDAKTIIIPGGKIERVSETNMGIKITDPIGWSSKTPAPSGGKGEGYGLLGKIPQLRPMSTDFNQELYNNLMNLGIEVRYKGIAVENGQEETAIMPTFELIGGEELIIPFSEIKTNLDIPTAKWFGINN
ncbi:MAG: hypothetical protein PHH06_02420 [Candidatus Gracilibacteria bacterium]|nr:hypothetical protein [Candidatus Gracilibacteria bacterium]